jgi:CoA:oxalate CoA-transferase
MLDCQVTVQENAFVRYLNTGEIPRALGTRHPVITPFQAFETKDGYIALALRGGIKDQWPLFCAAIDRVDLIDDPRFENGWLRTENYAVLEPVLTKAMKTKTTREWVDELERLSIPCGPVNTVEQAANDPQVAARDMIIDVHHPEAGKFKVVNTPFKFSRTQSKPERASPELGEHTQDVMSQLLGMTGEEINALRDSEVI